MIGVGISGNRASLRHVRKLLHVLGVDELDASTPLASLGLTSLQVRNPE